MNDATAGIRAVLSAYFEDYDCQWPESHRQDVADEIATAAIPPGSVVVSADDLRAVLDLIGPLFDDTFGWSQEQADGYDRLLSQIGESS